MDKLDDVGSKRKAVVSIDLMKEDAVCEKKLKLDDETKRLSALFATHLGSTEAAEQPRQVQ